MTTCSVCNFFQVLNVLFGHNKFFVARKFNVICNFQLNAKTGPCLIIWFLYILQTSTDRNLIITDVTLFLMLFTPAATVLTSASLNIKHYTLWLLPSDLKIF